MFFVLVIHKFERNIIMAILHKKRGAFAGQVKYYAERAIKMNSTLFS
jgi:hypothetical protein